MPAVEGPAEASRRRRCWILALIVAWGAVARVGSLVGPFGFGWQELGALYAIVARNFLRYGPIATRFAMVRNADVAPRDEWLFFTHHPPGMGLTTAAVASVIGEGPLALKLPGLLFSLLQIVVTYALVARVVSTRAGLVAAFATAVLPAGAYFATHGSDLGPQAISLALLALWLDERARDRDPDRPRCAPALAAASASLFFDWPALVVVGFVAARDALARRWRRALTFALVVPAVVALQQLHVRWATGSSDTGGSLLGAFFAHGVVGAAESLDGFDVADMVERVVHHLRFLFGDTGLAVGGAGIVLGLVGAARARRVDPVGVRRAWGVALGLAAFALLYTVPFPRAVVVHRFWAIVALPAIAFCCGVAVHATSRRRIALVAWVGAAIGFGVVSTWRVVRQQQLDRTPYFEELGDVLRRHVPSGREVFTPDHYSSCLAYYAQRTIHADLGDETIAGQDDDEVPLPTSGWIAIVRPPVAPSSLHSDRIVQLLERRGEPLRVELEQSHSTVLLFDVEHLRASAPTAPGGRR